MTAEPTGPDSYRVIARRASAELVERKSRFLATVRRVQTEEDARAVIEECRRNHRDAGHHCSAFVLGAQAEITRTSDDGEPAGTAGMPILETIRGHRLSDLVVVVSRWFGGTKLGTGGLVRAYSEATARGLSVAGSRSRVRVRSAGVAVDFERLGRVENELRSRPEALAAGLEVDEIDYTGGTPTIRITAPLRNWDEALAVLFELQLTAAPTGESWADRPIGGPAGSH
ncbi:IMPACT family protein [Naumannella halotolerans]|uniref:Putative YigZ family protein n=1 Tax=Naumannella halotolerans TaxID=993414 RepID=A0A4R7J1K6_9ACTN|nr:YigZ family protein [Naumannella halotolerans]TDT30895.1 putative YigZ family protein [Naumannella halotolerans]